MQHNPDSHDDLLFQRSHDLKAQGINPYKETFLRSHTLVEVNEEYEDTDEDTIRRVDKLHIYGRVMNISSNDTQVVIVIEDQDARFQVIGRALQMPPKRYELLKDHVYRGDYLAFEVSEICREHGNLAGIIDEWYFLSLANLPIPRHMDIDRQRAQRPLYWASSLDARERFVRRSKLIHRMRQFFISAGMLEVQTPYPLKGDADGQAVDASSNLLLYLIGGFEQVFEIRPGLKPEPVDWLNHPQALQFSGCTALKSIHDSMSMLEDMIIYLAQTMHGGSRVVWQPYERMDKTGNPEPAEQNEEQPLEIDLSGNWARRSLASLLKDMLGVEFSTLQTLEEAVDLAIAWGLNLTGSTQWKSASDVMHAVFYQLAITDLIQPTFVLFPSDETGRVERFELVINGISFASGHPESTDPSNRSGNHHVAKLSSNGNSLMIGMPHACSFNLHIDRLAMLLLNCVDIRDVIPFP